MKRANQIFSFELISLFGSFKCQLNSALFVEIWLTKNISASFVARKNTFFDNSTLYHFRGCRSFFRRSIRNRKSYNCQFNNDCEIKIGQRNACRACRLNKCLERGLNPDSMFPLRTLFLLISEIASDHRFDLDFSRKSKNRDNDKCITETYLEEVHKKRVHKKFDILINLRYNLVSHFNVVFTVNNIYRYLVAVIFHLELETSLFVLIRTMFKARSTTCLWWTDFWITTQKLIWRF